MLKFLVFVTGQKEKRREWVLFEYSSLCLNVISVFEVHSPLYPSTLPLDNSEIWCSMNKKDKIADKAFGSSDEKKKVTPLKRCHSQLTSWRLTVELI